MADEVKIKVTVDDAQANQAFKKLGQESETFTSSFTRGINVSNASFAVFAGSLAANAVASALGKIASLTREAVAESVNFKRAQLEIETILPKNTKLTADLVNQLSSLSKQYGTTSTEQAKAYYQIISAGVQDASDGTKLLARANELATGGVTNTASTIDLLTTIYNVYGKEVATAAEASDSLFKTVQLGKTTIAELSADLGQALPIAKSFGIGLDEVGAVLAQLTNAGISTSESVTLLNAVLSAIAKNGEQLGAGFNSTAVQTEGLGVVLERLKERTKGSNDALFELLGRQEAVRAVQALTSKGLENYNSTLAEYSNKAGVAADASKKIIDNDLGKQFDILGSKIGNASRSFIDLFIPATLAATKALNGFFSDSVVTDQEEVNRGLAINRVRIEQLESIYKSGKISIDTYKASLAKLNSEIAFLSNSASSAESPLVLLSTGLEKDVERIKAQIGSLKNGFDNLELGPIERDLKIDELNAKLIETTNKLKDINKVAAETVPVAPLVRSQQAVDDELKTQAEIKALREQFAIEETSLKELSYAQEQTDQFARKELEIQAVYTAESAKLEALASAEIEKTKIIKDESLKRATQEKIGYDLSLKNQKLESTKSLAEKQNQIDKQKAIDKGMLDATGNFIQAGILLAKDGSDVQKGLMITQAIVNTYAGATRAFADFPFPASAAVAGSVIALGLANVAKISGAKFEQGGIVPGLGQYGDQVQARLNPGEVVLNNTQQKELLDVANGRSNRNDGGGLAALVDAIRNQVNVIQIDGREIARTVRDQRASGYAV